CNDGRFCTTDRCTQSTGTCTDTEQPGCCSSNLECGDGNPCTTDTCNTNLHQCGHVPIAGCSFDAGTDGGIRDGGADGLPRDGAAGAGGSAGSGAGGTGGSGGGGDAGSAPDAAVGLEDGGGCSCTVAGQESARGSIALGAVLAAALVIRRTGRRPPRRGGPGWRRGHRARTG